MIYGPRLSKIPSCEINLPPWNFCQSDPISFFVRERLLGDPDPDLALSAQAIAVLPKMSFSTSPRSALDSCGKAERRMLLPVPTVVNDNSSRFSGDRYPKSICHIR